IDRKSRIVAPPRMHHVILTSAQGAIHPGIDQVESQRGIHGLGRVQRRGRLPCLVAHTSNELANIARWPKRYTIAITGDYLTASRKAGSFDLEPLDGRAHVAPRSADGAFPSHDMPGLERLPQLDLHARRGELAVPGEPELEVGRKPLLAECEPGCALLLD